MNKLVPILVSIGLAVSGILVGCAPEVQTGTLQFYANGEDFIRQGFVSKDGWALTIDHAYITLADITAYQSDPPYDPHQGDDIQAAVEGSLPGTQTVDLAEGGEDAPPIFVGEVEETPVGHYNAISWKVVKATEGPAEDYSLVVVGVAEKEGQTVSFTLRFEEEFKYIGGEFIGEERKGILQEGGTADLEMTFHFDHLFGDAELSPDDALNVDAVGFEMFAALAEAGVVDAEVTELEAEDYQKVKTILYSLGHVGEGHCHSELL